MSTNAARSRLLRLSRGRITAAAALAALALAAAACSSSSSPTTTTTVASGSSTTTAAAAGQPCTDQAALTASAIATEHKRAAPHRAP